MTTNSTGLNSVSFFDLTSRNIRLVVAGEKGQDTVALLTWLDAFEARKDEDSPTIVNLGTCASLKNSYEADIFILKEGVEEPLRHVFCTKTFFGKLRYL